MAPALSLVVLLALALLCGAQPLPVNVSVIIGTSRFASIATNEVTSPSPVGQGLWQSTAQYAAGAPDTVLASVTNMASSSSAVSDPISVYGFSFGPSLVNASTVLVTAPGPVALYRFELQFISLYCCVTSANSGNTNVAFLQVQMNLNGPTTSLTGNNLEFYKTYQFPCPSVIGGPFEDWGASLTPAQVASSNFGFQIKFRRLVNSSPGPPNPAAQFDAVRATLFQSFSVMLNTVGPLSGTAGTVVRVFGKMPPVFVTACVCLFEAISVPAICSNCPTALACIAPAGLTGPVSLELVCDTEPITRTFNLGTFVYPSVTNASLASITPTSVGAPSPSPTVVLTLTGSVPPSAQTWVSFVPIGANGCAGLISPTAYTAGVTVAMPVPGVGTYAVCVSALANSAGFMRQVGIVFTVYGVLGTEVLAVAPSAVAVGASGVNLTLTLDPASFGALFTATSYIALSTSPVCSGAPLVSAQLLTPPSLTVVWTPAYTFPGAPSTRYLCLSVSNGASYTYVYTLNVVGPTITAIKPSVAAAFTPIGFTFTAAADQVANMQIAFSPNASCGQSFEAYFVNQMPYKGASVYTLTLPFTGPAAATVANLLVCQSLAGGSTGTWISTAVTVKVVVVQPNEVWSVFPTSVVLGSPRTVNFTNLQVGLPMLYAFTMSASSCSVLCSTPALFTTPFPVASVLLQTCTFGAPAYLCVALTTGGSVYKHQGAGSALAFRRPIPPTVLIVAPASIAEDVATNVSLAPGAINETSFSPRVAFAPVGFCNLAAYRQAETAYATNVSVTLSAPANAAPPSQLYSLCFWWGPGSGTDWVEQPSTIHLAVLSSTALKSVIPGIVANATIPTLTINGAVGTPTTRIVPALQGSDCGVRIGAPLGALVTTDNIVPFPAPIPAVAPVLALCLSLDGGTTWVEQSLVTLGTTLDPLAGTVSSLTPRVLGVGSSIPSLTITSGDATPSTSLSFSLGACADFESRVSESFFTGPVNSVAFTLPTLGGAYKACYSQSPYTFYSTQIAAATSLLMVSGGSAAVAAISPLVLGATATTTLSLAASTAGPLGARSTLACVGCQIAFVPLSGSCLDGGARIGNFPLPDNSNGTQGGTIAVPMPTPLGVPSDAGAGFRLCFSTDAGTTWAAQSAVTLSIVQALPNTITAVTPHVLGYGATAIPVVVTGAPLSIQSVFSLSTTGGTCAGVVPGTITPLVTSTAFTIDTSALTVMTYTVCFSVDNGANWVPQTGQTVSIIDATAVTLTAVGPSIIAGGAPTVLSLTGTVEPSIFTAIAFVPYPAGLCSSSSDRTGVTVVSLASSVTVTVARPPSQQNYTACLTTSLGLPSELWVTQTAATTRITVSVALTNTLVSISPSVWAVNMAVTLQAVLAPGTLFPSTTLVALAPVVCEVGRAASGTLSPGTLTVPLTPNLSSPGTYRLCLSVDGGLTWALSPTVLYATVLEMLSNTIDSLSPTIVGGGALVNISAPSIVLGTGSSIVFTTAPSGCGGFGGQIFFPVGSQFRGVWSVPLNPPVDTTYAVCATYDNGLTWVRQDSAGVSILVLAATATSITTLVPPAVAVGIAGRPLTFGSLLPTSTSRIAFAPPGFTCANVPQFEAGFAFTNADTATLVAPLTAEGTYTVCYSTTGGAPYTAQSAVTLRAALGHTTDVLAMSPVYLPQNVPAVRVTLTLNTTLTTTSRVAFSEIAAGGCASGPRLGSTLVTAPLVVLASLLNASGAHEVCFTADSANWFRQDAVGNVTVGQAQVDNLQLITPSTIDRNSITEITLSGLVPSALSQFTLIYLGAAVAPGPTVPPPNTPNVCTNESLRVGGPTARPLPTATVTVTLTKAGFYGFCYSVDNGINWAFQSLPVARLEVFDCLSYTTCSTCHANPQCSYCPSTGVCSATRGCVGPLICPAVSSRLDCFANDCPAITSATGLTAAYTGGSTLKFAVDVLVPELSYYCEVAITNTIFVKRSPAINTAPGILECTAPPSELAATSASVRLFITPGDVLYTRSAGAGSVLPLTYYVCDTVPACTGCWSATRPDCGFCAATQSCTTTLLCARDLSPLWLTSGTCPTITAVSPAISPAVGGVTITASIASMVPSLQGLICAFGAATTNATVTADGGGVTCMTPAQTAGGAVVLSVSANGELYAELASGVSFSYEAPLPIPKPSKPFLTPPIIGGVVGGIICLLLIAALLSVFFVRKLARDKEVQPPELTDALREQIIYGAPAVLSADDKKRLPHLDDFFNRLVMNEEFIALVGEATAATEQDKLTKCVNVVYETRGRSLDLLLFQVSREVRTSYSQSTLFRTNSFATKLFKMFSKMHGLDYVHSILGRTLNELLLDVSEATAAKGADLRSAKSGDGDAALTRFAMLTKAQRLFQQVQKTESRLPIEFRYLFRHVQACLRERFPVRNEDLAEVISSSLIENIAATSTSFSDGSQAFETISSLQAAMTGDLAQLSAVFGPVSSQLQNFEAAMKDVVSQVTKMNKVVAQLQGAVDPRSSQAQALIAQHSAKQNSIAIGGFFFLRFLVPCLTAPEAYALVHEVPDTEQRKLLVVLGKVVQNLSNGLEFGAKEAHMVQFNDFIVENQVSMNALFDKLAAIPAAAPSLASLHDQGISVPRKRYEEAIAFVYSHTLAVLDKLGELLMAPSDDAKLDGEHRVLFQTLRESVLGIEAKAGASGSEAVLAKINNLGAKAANAPEPGSAVPPAAAAAAAAGAGVGAGAGGAGDDNQV